MISPRLNPAMWKGSRFLRMIPAFALLLFIICCGQSSSPPANPSTAPGSIQREVRSAAQPAQPADNLSDDERAEIRNTFARIASGERRYGQDGVTFQNRERRLPEEPDGYYREYTVETPGAPTRGARRLILGRSGEAYYSADHYRNFIKINPGDYNGNHDR